jgi:hypothetical protein
MQKNLSPRVEIYVFGPEFAEFKTTNMSLMELQAQITSSNSLEAF